MSVQTTYENQQAAFSGQSFDHNQATVDSMALEGGDVAGGNVVSQGTADNQCSVGGAARMGIAQRNNIHEGVPFEAGTVIPVKKAGRIWATVDGTGVKGAALTYNTTTGALSTRAVEAGYVLANAKLHRAQTSSGAIVPVVLADIDL